MPMIRLGRTDIVVEKDAFGALPIQRTGMEEARSLLRRAFDEGITFFDTARNYTDSEEKIGYALHDVRDKIYIATKTHAKNPETFWKELHISLNNLRTDYVDIHQFHNPSQCYKPGDGTGMYEAMCKAKEQGKIRFIGASNHRLTIAREIVDSGLYDTLQYPFSYLATDQEAELVNYCDSKNVGFICMKALAGGLLQNFRAAHAYIAQFKNALPIWGIQRERELDELLSCMRNPPAMDEDLRRAIDNDRKELQGEFCRGCGYCLPCPAQINIPVAARISLLLRRAPVETYTSASHREMMQRIENCTQCHHCLNHCPYKLDVPRILKDNLKDYNGFISNPQYS